MALMTVYHGGYQPVEKPEIRVNKYTKDFGEGFYCTIIKEQAQKWARRYTTKIVSVYDVRITSGLKVLENKEMTEEWLDFIVACRSGQPHDYDIVIWLMIRFILTFPIIWMEPLQGNSFGFWLNSNIRHIRLHFVRRRHLNA